MRLSLGSLLRMSRPYYVIQAIVPPIAGYLGVSEGTVSIRTALTLGGVFGLLAMAAWAGNEISDQGPDGRARTKAYHGLYVAGGTGVLRTRRVSIRAALIYILLLITLALGLAITINLAVLAVAILAGLVGLGYSLPPIRLKTRGLLGAFVTACGYGLLAFVAGCFASGGPVRMSAIGFGLIMSIFVLGYDGLGHIIDFEDDRANGLNTFAVQLGFPIAVRLLAACQVLPILALLFLRLIHVSNSSLEGIGPILAITMISAALLISNRGEQPLYILRVLSVPLLSLSFFLLR